MNQDDLKSAWQSLAQETTNLPLKSMTRERQHPIMKRISRQAIIEIVAFAIFLFVYNDFFDGNQKPVYANWLLGSAFVFAILNNVMWYRFTRFHPNGNNIRQLLQARISTMKTYAWISIGTRVLLAVSLLIFFISGITFSTMKYLILAGIISVLIVQMALLIRIWVRRVKGLEDTYGSLMNNE